MRRYDDNNRFGFSLVEVLVATTLSLILFAAGGLLFRTGIVTWRTGEANMRLQASLRYTLERVRTELRQADAAHVQIIDGAGFGDSDSVVFSIPVVCNSGPITLCERDCDLITAGDQNCLRICEWVEIAGDENFIWGAPLTWGCNKSSCMDADNDCGTYDYKYVRYWINIDQKLEREVLDSLGAVVVSQELMPELVDLQFSLNGSVITIDVTAQQGAGTERIRTAQISTDLYLRN